MNGYGTDLLTIAVAVRRTLLVRTVARAVCAVVVAGADSLSTPACRAATAASPRSASTVWVFVSRGSSSKPSIIAKVVGLSSLKLVPSHIANDVEGLLPATNQQRRQKVYWIQMCRVDDVSWIQRVSEFQPNEVYSLYTSEIGNRYPLNPTTYSALCDSKVLLCTRVRL